MTEFANDKCPICWDPITDNDNFCKTICKHKYHSNCISKYIFKKNSECPVCRSKLFDISKEEEDQDNQESDDEYDVTSPDLGNTELIINKIGNYLKEESIEFKDLIQNLCFLEHEEFEKLDDLQNNSDFIYGKIRYVINQNMNLLQTNSISY